MRHITALTLAVFAHLVLGLGGLAPARAQAAAPEPQAKSTPRPFLYQLEGHGATAYLFGTVHLPDKRVTALAPAVERALAEADAVFTEVELTREAERESQRAALLPAGERLSATLGEALAARLDQRLKRHRLALALFEGQRPWAVTALLPMLPILTELAQQPALDKVLYQRAVKDGKRVGGLETVAEQVGVFAGLAPEEDRALLTHALDQLDRYDREGRNGVEELLLAYLSGDPARLLALMDEGFAGDPALERKMADRIVWERNRRLSERIQAHIAQKPGDVHFFAVGALHLPDGAVAPTVGDGEASEAERARVRGMLTLLREAGYRVTRVTEAVPAATTK